MAYKDKKAQAAYHLARYHRRRAAAIEALGGKCVVCGTTENLEFDHIDPTDKSFCLAKCWSVSEERFQVEIAKCQLLCVMHHTEKTLTEGDNGKFYLRHGTYAMYRKRRCRCEPCRDAAREQSKKWK